MPGVVALAWWAASTVAAYALHGSVITVGWNEVTPVAARADPTVA